MATPTQRSGITGEEYRYARRLEARGHPKAAAAVVDVRKKGDAFYDHRKGMQLGPDGMGADESVAEYRERLNRELAQIKQAQRLNKEYLGAIRTMDRRERVANIQDTAGPAVKKTVAAAAGAVGGAAGGGGAGLITPIPGGTFIGVAVGAAAGAHTALDRVDTKQRLRALELQREYDKIDQEPAARAESPKQEDD